jgi:hypothetical protein
MQLIDLQGRMNLEWEQLKKTSLLQAEYPA